MVDGLAHAEPIPHFCDLLDEKYLWSEEYDEDKDLTRYKGGPFPAELFYSFYHYSHTVLVHHQDAIQLLSNSNSKIGIKAKTLYTLVHKNE